MQLTAKRFILALLLVLECSHILANLTGPEGDPRSVKKEHMKHSAGGKGAHSNGARTVQVIAAAVSADTADTSTAEHTQHAVDAGGDGAHSVSAAALSFDTATDTSSAAHATTAAIDTANQGNALHTALICTDLHCSALLCTA